MAADSDFVGCARLLRLNVDNKRGGKEGATQDKFRLLTREGARHPACQELLAQVILNVVHVRVSRRVVGKDDSVN